jgi:hypothetical protein
VPLCRQRWCSRSFVGGDPASIPLNLRNYAPCLLIARDFRVLSTNLWRDPHHICSLRGSEHPFHTFGDKQPSALRDFLAGHEELNSEDADLSKLAPCLLKKVGFPDLNQYEVTLEKLMVEGRRLAREQQHVMNSKLSEEYMKNMKESNAAGGLIGLQG